MSVNGRKGTLLSKKSFEMSFWKMMFLCLSAWLFESADACDLGLMTLFFFSRMLRDSTTCCQSVGWSVGRSVFFLLFWRIWAFYAYGSCPDSLVTFSSTAPAHPHATGVAVYPALFFSNTYSCSNAFSSTFRLSFPDWVYRDWKAHVLLLGPAGGGAIVILYKGLKFLCLRVLALSQLKAPIRKYRDRTFLLDFDEDWSKNYK